MRTAGAENWQPEREAELRRLWEEEGLPASEIAIIMGLPSRHAVIGKARRLNLSHRRHGAPGKRRANRARAGDSAMTQRFNSKRFPHLPTVLPGDTKRLIGAAWSPLPGSTPVTLTDLEPGMCKWPIGEAMPYLFCGLPCVGAYCEHHHAVAYKAVV